MRNLAIKYLESWKDWGCMGQQGMIDILIGFAELVEAQKTSTNSESKSAAQIFSDMDKRVSDLESFVSRYSSLHSVRG